MPVGLMSTASAQRFTDESHAADGCAGCAFGRSPFRIRYGRYFGSRTVDSITTGT